MGSVAALGTHCFTYQHQHSRLPVAQWWRRGQAQRRVARSAWPYAPARMVVRYAYDMLDNMLPIAAVSTCSWSLSCGVLFIRNRPSNGLCNTAAWQIASRASRWGPRGHRNETSTPHRHPPSTPQRCPSALPSPPTSVPAPPPAWASATATLPPPPPATTPRPPPSTPESRRRKSNSNLSANCAT